MAANTIAKIQARLVVQDDGCHVWPGAKTNGYGVVGWQDRIRRVHRLLYEHLVGPVPKGLDLDHLCRNRACANVGHLEPVTRSENLKRGNNWQRAKTHCPEGHPLSGDNLDPYTLKEGRRRCRTCHLRYQAGLQRRKKAAMRAQNEGLPEGVL